MLEQISMQEAEHGIQQRLNVGMQLAEQRDRVLYTPSRFDERKVETGHAQAVQAPATETAGNTLRPRYPTAPRLDSPETRRRRTVW